MTLALAVLAAAALAFFLIRARNKRPAADAQLDTTPALESWIASTLETELAEGALGIPNASAEERKRLAQSLRGEPDMEVVSKVEDKVRDVELEYTRYAHENDAEVLLRVRYEDGKSSTATRRLAWTDVPQAVRDDFENKKTSRVFRTWTFPWSRVRVM
ncbi:MAG TPA: hypothetical protein VIF62_18405 [Labilithrix sp.]|jgi:hypothetical protein